MQQNRHRDFPFFCWLVKHRLHIFPVAATSIQISALKNNELHFIINQIRTQSERSSCLWARKTKYVIQYLSGKLLGRHDFNINETRTLETHFINLYQTGKIGYNRNHQITGGCLDYVPKEYETAWADLPAAAILDKEDILNPPFDKMKLKKVKLFFINNGESLREAEETILYALHETLYGPTDPTGKIVVYNNDYLGAIEGITYNGNYYRFLISGLRETDTLYLHAFRGIPFEQNTFHWTGYLCKNIPSKAIACEPYLNELWEKVMKANEDRHHCDAEEYVMIQAGIDAVKDKGVFILATANNIVKLPDSLLRPGRFDRRIEFDTPTQDETARIIRYYLADKKLDDTVNLDDLSKMVDYESCATMETILNEAAVYAAYAGKDAIGTEDLVRAVLKLEYNGPERHCDILEEKIRRIAIHEAAHAVIAERLAPGSVGMLSIRKGDHAGMMHLCGKEKSPEVTAKICLAGKAAEEMFYPGEVAIGAADDIEKAIRSVLLQLNKQGTYGFGAVDIYPVQYDDSSPFQAFKQESMAQAVLDRYLFKVHSILQGEPGISDGPP